MDQLTGLPLTSPNTSTGELGSQGESSGRSTPSSDSAPGKLFVGGLSWQTSQEKLREYFGQFGNVTDVLVMKDPITQVRSCLLSPMLSVGEMGGRTSVLPLITTTLGKYVQYSTDPPPSQLAD